MLIVEVCHRDWSPHSVDSLEQLLSSVIMMMVVMMMMVTMMMI